MPLSTLQINMLEMTIRAQGANSAKDWHNNLSFLERTVQSNPTFIPTTSNYRLSADNKQFPVMG